MQNNSIVKTHINNQCISIIICTYNRSQDLKDVLDSLVSQETNASFDYEVIIVDNNSKDATKEIVKNYIPKFKGKLRYAFEANQGLSYARNRGIKEAKGEVIAFTDDDAIVDKYWIRYMYETFQKENCDALGGKILLKWNVSPPIWLTKRFYGYLGFLDFGNEPFQIKEEKFTFFGGNFAVKKDIFDETGPFNINLGRKGTKLSAGEEIDLFYRLLSANKKIYYQPNCLVYHKVHAERLQKSFFRKNYFYYGLWIFNTNRTTYNNNQQKYFFGISICLTKKILKLIFKYFKTYFYDKKSDELFGQELDIYYHLGIFYGTFKKNNNILLGN